MKLGISGVAAKHSFAPAQGLALSHVQVEIRDVSAQCSQLVLAGPGGKGLLQELGAPAELLDGPQGTHGLLNVGGRPVLLAVGSGLHHPGYTLLPDEGVAGELWSTLTDKVSRLCDSLQHDCAHAA